MKKKYVYILISYYIITKRFKYDSVIFIIISLKLTNSRSPLAQIWLQYLLYYKLEHKNNIILHLSGTFFTHIIGVLKNSVGV